MSSISNIIDALRRVGSATQKSALKRQDDFLEGKQVLERRQVNTDGSLGQMNAFIATIAPAQESIVVLSEEEIRPVRENAEYGIAFLGSFGIHKGVEWELDDLDIAFTAWQSAADKQGYSDNYVVEVLGAMFGEFCIENLNMRWIRLTDEDGTTLAVDGVQGVFRGFPYQTISKRIRASECGFFRPVFILLKHHSDEARSR